MRRVRGRSRCWNERGQGLVEFSLAITVFLMLLMGIVDAGRLVYQYNAVAETARSLAREASVHPGSPLGSSSQVGSVLATQRGLVPALGTPSYTCVDIAGTPVTGACQPGNWVRVSITSTFTPATPLATLLGTVVLKGTASVKIE